MIKVINITKKYENFVALDEVNLEIKAGSIFALIGENGSGKSSLLRVLAGVFAPEKGHAEVNGEMLYDNPQVKQDIIYISDSPHASNWSDIKELTLYYESFYSLDKARLTFYLNLFKVNLPKPLSKFSKGMRRRTYLAFALALAPKVLLLDEAVDGLDPQGKTLFKEELRRLSEKSGMTTVIATQSLKELEDICDSYAALQKGKVLIEGDVHQINRDYHQYQVAFKEEYSAGAFISPLVVSTKGVGKMHTIICRGPKNKCDAYIASLNPLVTQEIALSFAEVYGEMGGTK